jgi:transcriptional regulator with XRE-family HTH domain
MASSAFDRRFPADSSQTVKTLGRNVRRLRKGKGWTQDDLAECTEIEQAAISLIENGRANPTIKTVERIAACLGVTFIELFAGRGAKPQQP